MGPRLCRQCGKRTTRKHSRLKDGSWHYGPTCRSCHNEKYGPLGKRNYKRKGDRCDNCGFVADDPSQLDVDHIIPLVDGGTDEDDNIQTLCANCHRLKTRFEIRRRRNHAEC